MEDQAEPRALLLVRNRQSKDCGPPPHVPVDAEYCSYFENKHGEQFLFWVKDKQIFLRAGDCGWQTVMQPQLTDLGILSRAGHSIGGPAMELILSGMPAYYPILHYGEHEDAKVLFVVDDERGSLISYDLPERLWLASCVEACGLAPPMLDVAGLIALVRRLEEIADDRLGEDDEEDDEDDE